ncbi:unnamed protein product [Pedinophyceae sp. YPF-701]|nr:unnamed protein product [Pedinophyceae sp. YPF-701]
MSSGARNRSLFRTTHALHAHRNRGRPSRGRCRCVALLLLVLVAVVGVALFELRFLSSLEGPDGPSFTFGLQPFAHSLKERQDSSSEHVVGAADDGDVAVVEETEPTAGGNEETPEPDTSSQASSDMAAESTGAPGGDSAAEPTSTATPAGLGEDGSAPGATEAATDAAVPTTAPADSVQGGSVGNNNSTEAAGLAAADARATDAALDDATPEGNLSTRGAPAVALETAAPLAGGDNSTDAGGRGGREPALGGPGATLGGGQERLGRNAATVAAVKRKKEKRAKKRAKKKKWGVPGAAAGNATTAAGAVGSGEIAGAVAGNATTAAGAVGSGETAGGAMQGPESAASDAANATAVGEVTSMAAAKDEGGVEGAVAAENAATEAAVSDGSGTDPPGDGTVESGATVRGNATAGGGGAAAALDGAGASSVRSEADEGGATAVVVVDDGGEDATPGVAGDGVVPGDVVAPSDAGGDVGGGDADAAVTATEAGDPAEGSPSEHGEDEAVTPNAAVDATTPDVDGTQSAPTTPAGDDADPAEADPAATEPAAEPAATDAGDQGTDRSPGGAVSGEAEATTASGEAAVPAAREPRNPRAPEASEACEGGGSVDLDDGCTVVDDAQRCVIGGLCFDRDAYERCHAEGAAGVDALVCVTGAEERARVVRGAAAAAFKTVMQQARDADAASPEWWDAASAVVDALDALVLMGLEKEHGEAQAWVLANVRIDSLPSMPESGLPTFHSRMVGGLLSAFTLTGNAKVKQLLLRAADAEIFLWKCHRDVGPHIDDADVRAPAEWACPEGLGASEDGHALAHLPVASAVALESLSAISGDARYARVVRAVYRAMVADAARTDIGVRFPSRVGGAAESARFGFGAESAGFYRALIETWSATGGKDGALQGVWRGVLEAWAKLAARVARTSAPGDPPVLVSEEEGSALFEADACAIAGSLAELTRAEAAPSFTCSDIRGAGADAGWPGEGECGALAVAELLAETCYRIGRESPSGLAPDAVRGTEQGAPERAGAPDAEAPLAFMGLEAAKKRWSRQEGAPMSWWALWRTTGRARYREWGWRLFVAMERSSKDGSGAYRDVRNVLGATGERDERPRTTTLPSILKWLYLTFSEGGGPDGTGLLDWDKWVVSSGAHPVPIKELRVDDVGAWSAEENENASEE